MRLVTTWEEWCRVYADLDLWQDEVHAVCRMHGVAIQRIDKTFPGTHAAFVVNDDLVLKFFCPVRYNSSALERRLHETILAGNDLFPRVRFHGTSPHRYDYLAFTRVNGTSLRELGMAAMPRQTIEALAVLIAGIHHKTLEQNDTGVQCQVHYDLGDDHIYLDDTGCLAGIIDWGDARIVHPSAEFPALFVAGFHSDDAIIDIFTQTYNASFGAYRIDNRDIANALMVHDFRDDMLAILQQQETRFAREMVRLCNGMSDEITL
jgi:hypothetical protein